MTDDSETTILDQLARKALEQRAEALEQVRRRAGLSVDGLAKEMGFKGASSIQRYLGAEYDKGFRPELVRAFRKALLGKGSPPITDADLAFLLREKHVEPGDPLWDTIKVSTRHAFNEKFNLRPAHDHEAERLTTRLPLVEGDVIVEMPRLMSSKSLFALKAWLIHLTDYAEDSLTLADARENREASHAKKWPE